MIRIKSFVERDSKLVELTRGKSVLHLGCVGFTDCTPIEKVALAKQSLHAFITKEASDCMGVDLDGPTIRELQKHGIFTNVVEGDVEQLDALPREFSNYDVIVAGDIIEHLSNPGLMLDGAKGRLAENGRLVVSTPNAFGIAGWIRVLTGRFREGEQHVLCFNPITLGQLLERHGYMIDTAHSCYQSRAKQNFGIWFKILRSALERFPKYGGTLLYICSLNSENDAGSPH
jgi:2-polyprenyl-3-methyl-5-hydroxy-6-metoxy-1,4-benzoquinol methylase